MNLITIEKKHLIFYYLMSKVKMYDINHKNDLVN